MTSGAITIAPDEEWRGDISPRDRAVGTAIALPLLHRYGLPVRSADHSTRPTLTMNAWLRFDTIRRDLQTAKPKTVLEVGAGEGGLGSWLARHFTYTGVEPDARSRAAAVARLEPGRGQIVGQLDDVADQEFDAVCAFEVLEHIAEDKKALEQWREYLRPSGWLLLSVPAHADDFGAADELVGHYRRYEQSSLTGLLQDAGFEVVRLSSYGAGLGHVLQRGRNAVAKRVATKRVAGSDTPEDRSSGSGRFMQPRQHAVAIACATIAAPGRLMQRPFAGTNIGTGYVVLARRSE